MTYCALAVDPIPFSAQLFPGTWSEGGAAYSAPAPSASPSQVVKIDRNLRMMDYFKQAMDEGRALGAMPSISAVEDFEALLPTLPEVLPLTDPYITSVGSICLDWDDDSKRQLSLIFKGNRQVAFAAYFSGEKMHGSARFSSLQLPEGFLDLARRWSISNNVRR